MPYRQWEGNEDMPSRGKASSDERQMILPLSPVHNRDFLSNHWLEHRLPLEPEWHEERSAALDVLQRLQKLWQTQETRVGLYGDEAGLEEKFIQPVFEALGWHIKYQAFLDGREPDYALFLRDDDLHQAISAGRTNPDFWASAAAVADAKAWHISLDRPIRNQGKREYPPEQIEWYLNHSLRDYGILTNGRLWRLVPRVLGPAKPRFQTYIEVDLPELLRRITPTGGQLDLGPSGSDLDDFLRFFLLFSPSGFASVAGRKRLLDRAVQGSSEFSIGVGEELKERVFEALRLCVEGFIKHGPNKLEPAGDLRACQEHSLIFLYRLLFILYAEDRGLLPYRVNQIYTNNRSLARHRDEVASRLDQVGQGFKGSDFSRTSADLWKDLGDLFDLIDRGHSRYGVQAYNGGLFDLEGDSFLSEKVLPDWYLARVLDQLGRTSQPGRPALGLFRVDYRDLAIQQLGSVYEGLLELRPRYATSSMRVVRAKGAQDELVVSATEPIPAGYQPTAITYDAESIYLATDKGERRRSGSYYTPDHIVDHIVQAAIGAKCREIDAQLQSEIASVEAALKTARNGKKETLVDQLQALQGTFDDRILNLKILDPAMGSGHFLIRACQYLAEEIATNPNTGDHAADDLRGDDSTITYWKRRVAESCLHGVDANPMAVELAKLALWLETVASDAPLTFLDHHFRWGDSIIGARIARLDSLPGDQGLLAGQFQQQVASALPTLLDPLDEISRIPSDTAEQVKQKEQIYKRRFLPALERFSLVGDVWAADAMAPSSISRRDYAEVLRLLGSPRKFDEYADSDPVRQAISPLASNDVLPFHWELAYPHVFLADRPGGRTGFDAIIGNPPYDVLSERETGHSVEHLKRFIDIDLALHCSRVGKNNLYKIFVARSWELLTEGGLLSFIVPMPLLGDEQSSGIRKMLFDGGRFMELHAFPQKDNPQKRVFRDAKLSTAVFVYQKALPERSSNSAFTSQLHPAQFIEPSTPRLSLNSNSVKTYDPANLTIVSCRQDDWDLVTQLAEQPNSRFREYVNFFQGEVNQTVATAQGLLAKEGKGPLIMRGANISLYQLREASQGEDIYLNVTAFLRGKSRDTKAYHHEFERVGLQESSPQNNFRRIISCRIPKGQFCNHKINYTTSHHATIPLELVLFVLNSTFADWYFRLGSTNAAVSHYQLGNIPCPRFGQIKSSVDKAFEKKVGACLDARDFDLVDSLCLERAAVDGCSPTVERAVSALVQFIEREESARGKIARTERSSLSPDAEHCQIVLDKIMLALLGLSSEYHTYLRGRVSEML
jgi:Eco57I restriction-modification methylase